MAYAQIMPKSHEIQAALKIFNGENRQIWIGSSCYAYSGYSRTACKIHKSN